MGKLINLTGQKFGELTVLERAENNPFGKTMWLCKCDCGTVKAVASTFLLTGQTVSCGCKRNNRFLKHNSYKKRLYKVYRGIISRCYEPSNTSYHNYGERGIKVCNEWKNDYLVFEKWALENGYDKNAKRGTCTIDRIDVNGDYCPDNCRWINIHEQCKNKRNNRIYTYNNEKLCLKDWAEKLKMNYQTLLGRLKKGWSFEDAITIPIRKFSKKDIQEVE